MFGIIVSLLICLPWWLGTTYIVEKNGAEVERFKVEDGAHRTTVMEDGVPVRSWLGDPGDEQKNKNIPSQESRLRLTPKPPTKGKIRTLTRYYETGPVKSKATLIGNKLHGKYSAFFKNGSKKIIRHYHFGTLQGLSIAWDPDKNLSAAAYYHHGSIYGPVAVYSPFYEALCIAWYWNGDFKFPIMRPGCQDVAKMAEQYFEDKAVYHP